MTIDSGETSLFPKESRRAATENYLSALLDNSQLRKPNGQVSPTVDLAKFRDELSCMTFSEPVDINKLLDWTVNNMQAGLVQTTHRRNFGLYNPAPTFPAELAARIAAAFNPQICVWSHAPVAVDIENHVVEHICRRVGMPDGSGGHFTSGGSEANNTAVVCALTSGNTDFAEEGVRAYPGQPRIYVSKESHLAWLKISHQLGIGRCAVRLIGTDGHGRMDSKKLSCAIQSDRVAGDVPVLIAATAGTTNTGVVDPLGSCAEIAKDFGVWFHVDAAWGGALMASTKFRSALNGMERADSITIDAHKWFATTMGAGIYLTRRVSVLHEAFRIATDYMPSNDSKVDLYVNSIQWSRRFVGLRLFLSLGVAGWQGYAAHVEHSIDLIKQLTDHLVENDWVLVNDSQMAVACLVPPARCLTVDEIVARVVESGDSWVSATKFEGQSVVRVCLTNGCTTAADIHCLANQLVTLTS
jgi:glutamate/tyrosine decarboxylase-like PLP-dependent enzyme